MFKVERRFQYDVVDIVLLFLVLALNIFQTCSSVSPSNYRVSSLIVSHNIIGP